MDVRMQTAASLKESNPPMKLTNGLLNGQSNWLRSGSFSSSNDSAVFCGPNFTLSKQTHNGGPPSRVLERNRNSSGSSASSNMSCVSEKGLKKPDDPAKVLEGGRKLNQMNVGLSNHKLQHKGAITDTSSSLLPYRHNLRRNIRKKKCSCDCTATCTTFVVSRFKEIGKNTVEEKTVISRTEVQTCVKNTVVPGLQYGKSCSSSKTDSNRRRRSEMEKLYDSLHQIEWAKNFSPDNILRQINIRQAASCSVFGRSNDKTDLKYQKKEKGMNNLEKTKFARNTPQKFNSSTSKSTCTRKTNQFNSLPETHNTQELRRSSRGKNKLQEPHIKNNSKSPCRPYLRNRSNSQNSNLDHSLSESPVNNSDLFQIEERSVSPISDCTDLSTTSGDNPSWTDNHFEGLIESNTYVPDLTSNFLIAPTFFDLAGEGIRTIDACFREVGAEVVISTCYDEDFEIPLLTSVGEENLSDKLETVEENPPVLEPCINFRHPMSSSFICADITSGVLDPPESLHLELEPDETKEVFNRTLNEMQRKYVSQHKKCFLLKKAVKRIVKKYFRLLAAKCKAEEVSLENHTPKAFPPLLGVDKTSRKINKNRSCASSMSLLKTFSNCPQKLKRYSLGETSSSLGVNVSKYPEKILSKRPESKLKCLTKNVDNCLPAVKESLVQFPNKVHFSEYPERITYKHKKSSFSCTKSGFNSNISTKFSNEVMAFSKSPDKFILNQRKSSFACNKDEERNASSKKNISASFSSKEVTFSQSPAKISFNQRESSMAYDEDEQIDSSMTTSSTSLNCASFAIETCMQVEQAEIPRPKSFSVHYSTITVNHANDYTQVILKCNRGQTTFLTVESLLELREVVVRSGSNNSCHTLILNGIGDSFCMGLDLRPLLGSQKKRASHEIARAVRDFIEVLSSFKKPFVAVVNGAAYGLGLTILTHADVIIANESATFCMPQSSLGYFPEGGATLTLPQAVGSTVAMDLILRGKTITAIEAKNIGLISEVLDDKDLPFDLVSRISMLSAHSLSSMETTKAMFKMRLHMELLNVLENEVKLLPQMWLSQSCQEALHSASL